ncbi:hypothetical protein OG453_44200 [Streptomyces sp. NBC_01381]|uniref:hypothetical protein n=1 Tax=Streptomyces sp. NBC_01381 TaxID=2903845 RepID=UPI002253516A|nr:hypothetical protein [Streptomyces sp. NBC_01381]MCX4673562.1 hypothetical protein [Streptomyces sp. NBC_01381]
MSQWTVTIPTFRMIGAEPVHGTQTWIVSADLPQQARDLALAAAATDDAMRHRRGAALDTTAIDVAPRERDGSPTACL